MKPILFNTENVQALLDGRKSVTRRVVKQEHLRGLEAIKAETIKKNCIAPYRPGDVLYVRETWDVHPCYDNLPPNFPCKKASAGQGCYVYLADRSSGITPCGIWPSPHPWRPSIHMPKEAARLFLRVTDVRVEQLQDIENNETALRKECVAASCLTLLNGAFAALWDSTIKKADLPRYGWAANPWVWVIEFERISKEEAFAST